MTRRQMGEGNALRVLFGRQPHASPMRRKKKGCGFLLGALLVLAMTTTALVAATNQAMGFAWT